MKISGGKRNENYPLVKDTIVVSIIIVTYNAGNYLKHCLDSIINQSFKNIELVIFDGISKDNTVDILKAYDKYISYWQSEPDSGIYDAMNKAASYASGDFLYFLGADDALLSGFSDMAEKLKNPAVLYYGYCFRKDKQTNEKIPLYTLAKNNLCHHAIFYPKHIFLKNKYDTRYIVKADHALNIKCWGDKSLLKQYLPIAIAAYGPDGFSTRVKDDVFDAEQAGLIKKYFGGITYARFWFKKWKESMRAHKNKV